MMSTTIAGPQRDGTEAIACLTISVKGEHENEKTTKDVKGVIVKFGKVYPKCNNCLKPLSNCDTMLLLPNTGCQREEITKIKGELYHFRKGTFDVPLNLELEVMDHLNHLFVQIDFGESKKSKNSVFQQYIQEFSKSIKILKKENLFQNETLNLYGLKQGDSNERATLVKLEPQRTNGAANWNILKKCSAEDAELHRCGPLLQGCYDVVKKFYHVKVIGSYSVDSLGEITSFLFGEVTQDEKPSDSVDHGYTEASDIAKTTTVKEEHVCKCKTIIVKVVQNPLGQASVAATKGDDNGGKKVTENVDSSKVECSPNDVGSQDDKDPDSLDEDALLKAPSSRQMDAILSRGDASSVTKVKKLEELKKSLNEDALIPSANNAISILEENMTKNIKYFHSVLRKGKPSPGVKLAQEIVTVLEGNLNLVRCVGNEIKLLEKLLKEKEDKEKLLRDQLIEKKEKIEK